MIIHFGFVVKVVNVKTAFPYGKLEGEISMKCPLGPKGIGKDNCILLGEHIHGLVKQKHSHEELRCKSAWKAFDDRWEAWISKKVLKIFEDKGKVVKDDILSPNVYFTDELKKV